MLKESSNKTFLVVGIIVASAASLSFISYQYSTAASASIVDLAVEDARSNAEIQAHDLSALLGKQIESAANNLQTLASSKWAQNQEVERGIPVLTSAQKSTNDITSAYSWLDKDGRILWATGFSDPELERQFAGADFSYREYYLKPRETLSPYYSTLFENVDGNPRLTISYPIIGETPTETDNEEATTSSGTTFNGVVVASIDVNTLGKVVEGQLVPDYKSSIGLMDRNGVILYSSSSPQNIGKNVFGPEIQSIIPSDVKESFNHFIRESLMGNTGSGDFTSQRKTSTIAYKPVMVGANEFALMYIVTPHELAASATELIGQQRILNLVTIIAIAGVAASISSIVLIWNKRLNYAVTGKTQELKFSNESLIESNRQLQVSNTKLKEANEQLLVHEKMQKEFVNVAAHELRTPVQPLLGITELLQQSMDGKNKVEVTKEDLEVLVRNAKRLEHLSSDILEVTRIESQSLKLNTESFNLNEKIQHVITDVKSFIKQGQKVELIFQPKVTAPLIVEADNGRIFQVLSNLLRNAIKFTEQGTIFVSLEEKDDHAVVTVKDTGEGIDAEIFPKLFTKFVSKSEQGTGLGLYLSKNIIEAHGGEIWAENNKNGRGATFTFTIPPKAKRLMTGPPLS